MSGSGYFLVRGEQGFLVMSGAGGVPFPRLPLLARTDDVLLLGEWGGVPYFACEAEVLPAECGAVLQGGEWVSVRALFALAGAEAFALAGRAVFLLDWQKNHRYCGRCATPTRRQAHEYAMVCPGCGFLAYPRMSPAVMVLVRRGDTLLLARSPRFKAGVFSALAGFVEAGETLEACAQREVREEVGIEIANLRYFRSQPWPFPDSLMLAFFADYAGGELCLDPAEIEAAGWFALDALPPLPDPASIARRLIDAACAEMR